MHRHLGTAAVRRLTRAPIIALYQKEKFKVDLGSAFLEPSLDRVYAFHIEKNGLHPLSTFCEFENEIKAAGEDGFGRNGAWPASRRNPEMIGWLTA
jgi:hypothetical protein